LQTNCDFETSENPISRASDPSAPKIDRHADILQKRA
jgi:hypothetical protein